MGTAPANNPFKELKDEPALTVVAACSNVHEAHLACSALEAAGIPVIIDNEHVVSMNWMFSNLVGGVKVLVESRHADQARDILTNTATDVQFPDGMAADSEDGCRQCGGTEFDSAPPSLGLSILTWLALGFPIAIPVRRRYCRNCGTPADT